MKKGKVQRRKEALILVRKLFDDAKSSFNKNPSLSNNYIKLARKTAMKVNLRMPRELKRRYCKHCYFYLVPGKNSRVRIHKSRVIYYCFNCRKYMRFLKR
ncbi:MAG: ribonuclease P [Nanoarchaeota archaeon]